MANARTVVLELLMEWVDCKNMQPTRKALLDGVYQPPPGRLQELSDAIDEMLADGTLVERRVPGYPHERLARPGRRMAPFWYENEQWRDSGTA